MTDETKDEMSPEEAATSPENASGQADAAETGAGNGENAAEEETAVQFSDVVFSYSAQDPVPAVNGVSFSVRRGEFISILGQNGSGKSTVAKLCDGLLEADSGEIRVFGTVLDGDKAINEARKRVGIVFQNPDNQAVASIVEDDIAFGPENLGVPREEIGRRIDWALEAVGMTEYRNATPERLSGGQKQRIAVAGILAIKPDVIILDEATAMLDPRGRKDVISVVQKLNEEEGITVILITHFMEEALLADRALVMHRGEIVMQGSPETIFESGDMLRTFNLVQPPVIEIQNELNAFGLGLRPTLDVAELAGEMAEKAEGLGTRSVGYDAPDDGERSGEWDIEVENLTYTYSRKSPFATKALDGVSLRIADGEFFGIIGQTGSGKSTLVQHFNALMRLPQSMKRYREKKPKKGQPPAVRSEIHVGKYDLGDKKCPFRDLRADVGMVFQYPEYQLFAETVSADVAFGLKNFRKDMTQEETDRAVREAIEVVGLDYGEVKDKSPFDLSGGQKRRVAIAGVIVTRPQILILDEPAAGLDPMGKQEIMELLHRLHRDWCRTVIIVSHDMDEIAENCTRAAVMSEGHVVMCEPPRELFRHGDELLSLGLDIPLTAKICEELKKYGITVECDFTTRGFVSSVERLFAGMTEEDNAQ